MSNAIAFVMTTTELSDSELLQLMLGGDRDAFAEVYRRRHLNVYRFALQMSGAREVAEDVTQEVFMVLIREGNVFDEKRGSLKAFLLGIARNQVLRRLRRERSFVAIEDADVSLETIETEPQEQEHSRNEAIRSLHKALLSLPEHYREVVVLCELQEMSYVEAAEALGCPVGTVRSRLHRARAMLIDRLRPADSKDLVEADLSGERCFA